MDDEAIKNNMRTRIEALKVAENKIRAVRQDEESELRQLINKDILGHDHGSSWVLVTVEEGIIGTVEIHRTEPEAKTSFLAIYGHTYDAWCNDNSDAHAELKANGITTEIVEIEPL